MEKRIVFWINADITIFSMAKFLQQKINDDFFAVIDITNKPKKFFQKQNIVKFKKSWFYHDHVKNELKNVTKAVFLILLAYVVIAFTTIELLEAIK